MKIFAARTLFHAAAILGLGALACTASLVTTHAEARAQIGGGIFWIFQPQSVEPVGRAWCNADHSVEYWAYVEGEYQFSSPENVAGNRWNLSAESAPCISFPDFESFKFSVLQSPEFAGKRIRFQNHTVVEEVVGN